MKAIETKYKGYRFRSRLEARWARFFDELNERWDYEKEGYNLDGIYYLPDFWLPKFGMFFEIKGEPPTKEERLKCERLRDSTGKAVAIFYGLPGHGEGTLYCWDQGEDSAGSSDWEVWLMGDIYGRLLLDIPESRNHEIYLAEDCSKIWEINDSRSAPEFLEAAINAAKSARFEHGENGN